METRAKREMVREKSPLPLPPPPPPPSTLKTVCRRKKSRICQKDFSRYNDIE